ncbi:MAG: GTP-binding protein [Candidatus Solibacter sp.]
MKADYFMIGGFLGAGKTTALLQLARRLTAQGRRVGVIANDQSHGLVDTALLAAHGFPVEEISGGCFCCRFLALTQAVERLASRAAPDVILAEPVGSCTDLRATVQYPLRRMYGGRYRVGPLSVLVDPLRALRVLGRESGRPFSAKVLYIYGKQLEEADLIVINKCDLLDGERAAGLERALRERYAGAGILRVSARQGTGLDRWLTALAAEAGSPAAPQVDYNLYAEGEALLGWLNGTVRVNAPAPFDGNRFLMDLGGHIGRTLGAEGVEIAHLKMTLARDGGTPALAVLNLVASGSEPELRYAMEAPLTAGTLTVNLRAESAPETLRGAVEAALAASGQLAEVRQLACFRPARPVPTHRMADG